MFDAIRKKLKDSLTTLQQTFSKVDRLEKEAKAIRLEERQPEEEREEGVKSRSLLRHKITENEISRVYGIISDAMLENGVAASVLEEIHKDLLIKLHGTEVPVLGVNKAIDIAIRDSILSILIEEPKDKLLEKIKSKKPYVILFIGVNGAGKTTTIAKVAKFLIDKGLKPVAAAGDTFRAASIEQLEIHCRKLGMDIVKSKYGADPASVAFDAISHAKKSNLDVVLIDTAGRSDINKNLIEELKKLKKVSKPDLTIFVGDALTGADAVNQAKIFDGDIGIDGTILSKSDVDKKGGAVLSISYMTKKPIIFLGTGQGYDDLIPFDKKKTVEFILP
jgi:fused signal recognition particle receptor